MVLAVSDDHNNSATLLPSLNLITVKINAVSSGIDLTSINLMLTFFIKLKANTEVNIVEASNIPNYILITSIDYHYTQDHWEFALD